MYMQGLNLILVSEVCAKKAIIYLNITSTVTDHCRILVHIQKINWYVTLEK